MARRPFPERVATLSALDDRTRAALHDLVARADRPVGRDEAADVLGIPRSTAAFHLDKLVDAGLLQVTYRRLSGRTGPGAGRPAKLYARSPEEVSVTVPDRHYDLAADVLAAAIEESARTGEPAQAAVARVARRTGESLGAAAGSLQRVLAERGFEPATRPDGSIVLRNCPFHRLVADHPELVCGLNLALLDGVAAGCGDTEHTVVADPGEGHCCVRVDPVGRAAGPVRADDVPAGSAAACRRAG